MEDPRESFNELIDTPLDFSAFVMNQLKATTDQLDWNNPEVEWHNYKHLDWITVRKDDDKLYKFEEGDFNRLHFQYIEDMMLLLVQGKLTNLTVEERLAFNMKYLPQTIWRQSDRDKAGAMVQAIDKQLKTKRIMQSLEKFIGQYFYKVVRHRYSNPMIQPEPEGSTQGYLLDSVEVLRYDTKGEKVRIRKRVD
ncbi:hypothetical protein Tco_0951450 [Tanacetum coccineum]|uniref:Uncharacterized protein n=1 Tax=Tanacetum coccineum TaxID=301880 RepID=A0ABQ5DU61_9ASTR